MKSKALHLLLASLAMQYGLRPDARAGEAVFSADGKSVLCLQPQTATILRIAIPQKPGEEPEAFDLSKTVGEKAVLRAICRTKDGTFMLAAPAALFTWKPGGDPQQAAAAPESHKISEVAVHPLTGGIMAPGFREAQEEQSPALMVRDPGEKNLASQESLPQNMSTAIFDGEGRRAPSSPAS